MKNDRLSARASAEERERLAEAARILDIPEAQIIREAVRDRVEKLWRTHPKLKQAQAEASV